MRPYFFTRTHTGDAWVLHHGTNIFSSLYECNSCHGRVHGLESCRRRTGRTTGKWSGRPIHIFSHICTLTYILPHTHIHTHTFSLSLSHTHTHSFSLSLTHSHIHTHIHTQAAEEWLKREDPFAFQLRDEIMKLYGNPASPIRPEVGTFIYLIYLHLCI